MLLSDGEILLARNNGELTIDPFPPSSSIQPASIDLRLDALIRVQKPGTAGMTLDPIELDVNSYIKNHTDEVNIASANGYTLKPGLFIIGKTVETVGLGNRLSGRVEGKSRLARLGVGVHITAPKIDPGFYNQITLEIFHLGNTDVKISNGMTICTLLVERLGHPAGEGYHGMFQGI
jgi:dCTP deaminase